MKNTPEQELAYAVVMQFVRDYCAPNVSAKKKRIILMDLRSDWMNFISNGASLIVADQLEKHPEEIAARLKRL